MPPPPTFLPVSRHTCASSGLASRERDSTTMRKMVWEREEVLFMRVSPKWRCRSPLSSSSSTWSVCAWEGTGMRVDQAQMEEHLERCDGWAVLHKHAA